MPIRNGGKKKVKDEVMVPSVVKIAETTEAMAETKAQGTLLMNIWVADLLKT